MHFTRALLSKLHAALNSHYDSQEVPLSTADRPHSTVSGLRGLTITTIFQTIVVDLAGIKRVSAFSQPGLALKALLCDSQLVF